MSIFAPSLQSAALYACDPLKIMISLFDIKQFCGWKYNILYLFWIKNYLLRIDFFGYFGKTSAFLLFPHNQSVKFYDFGVWLKIMLFLTVCYQK